MRSSSTRCPTTQGTPSWHTGLHPKYSTCHPSTDVPSHLDQPAGSLHSLDQKELTGGWRKRESLQQHYLKHGGCQRVLSQTTKGWPCQLRKTRSHQHVAGAVLREGVLRSQGETTGICLRGKVLRSQGETTGICLRVEVLRSQGETTDRCLRGQVATAPQGPRAIQ